MTDAALPQPDSLRCFVETARLLNFRAAGRAVGLTPAAVSQRILHLEEMLGVKLFHRTTRTVVLTEAGLATLPYAERALESSRACFRAAQGELGPPKMELTIGTRHELGLSWVLPQLPRLRDAHPGITAHLYFGSGPDLLLRVRTLEIDCAITSTRLTDPKLDAARLHEETYAFVGERKLLQKTPLEKPEHAKRHTLVDTAETLPLFHYWRDAPGGVDSLAFGAIVRMGTIAAMRELVLRGEGVAVLPEYFVREDLEKKRLVRLFPKVTPLSDHFRLVFRADDPRRSVYAALAETMRQVPLS
ncbi:MAG TPA: LysR family transcriptional regulator [Polyangiaceae bacterium]|nr:LysR family transcriptional regulator [Polyangiaceae bacterium]